MPGPHMLFQTTGAAPPPLPPRQPSQSYLGNNDYRPYGSGFGYGSYGSSFGYGSGYRGYGGYGSFGSYIPYSGSGYGISGHSGDVESRFQQYAEESTRSTFRVVETVLHTFSSITMLLESTYFALTNSFRAILSVADNIGRLHSTIGQLLSTFALIRFMKWVYRKILFTLGLHTQSAVAEDLWQSMSQLNGEQLPITSMANNRTSPWMNILLLGVFVALPYLIHKISSNIRQSQIKVNDPKEWVKCEDPVCVATAMYDFMAVSNEELGLRAGQKIWLAPRSLQFKSIPGWWIATDNRNVGLVPANYVTIVGQLKRKSESESNGNVIASSIIPTSMQSATASDEQMNTLEPNTSQQSTAEFSENNIKSDLL
ncbi:hypothetical protein PUN28_013830 [Cardiocondyla obscurior]